MCLDEEEGTPSPKTAAAASAAGDLCILNGEGTRGMVLEDEYILDPDGRCCGPVLRLIEVPFVLVLEVVIGSIAFIKRYTGDEPVRYTRSSRAEAKRPDRGPVLVGWSTRGSVHKGGRRKQILGRVKLITFTIELSKFDRPTSTEYYTTARRRRPR
jgi:hypothetical protein